MKKIILSFLFCAFTFFSFSQSKKIIAVDDSVKAIQFYQELFVGKSGTKLNAQVHDANTFFNFSLKKNNQAEIIFGLNKSSEQSALLSKGLHVDENKNGLSFKYHLADSGTFKTLLTLIVDSTTNSTFYTGYIFLPNEKKWKLMGSFKQPNTVQYVRSMQLQLSKNNNAEFKNAWAQRENGSWKNLNNNSGERPIVDVTKNIDSTEQHKIDLAILNKAIAEKKIDTTGSVGNVYYKILKEGTGEKVIVSDTVTVFYKGWLFSDNSVFDQTKEKPATFPLKRLIKGWQLALPQCNVGGTIRMYIPSTIAYSIRARSKAIPPNSILVFDVEVVGKK